MADEAPKPSAPQWLLSRDGKSYGPMTSGQLKQLCQTGKIRPVDLICRAGSDQWTPAGEIRGLFPPASVTSAPETAEAAPVRPVEEATDVASSNADAYWKTLGSLFCLANLVACGAYGLVKSPPAIVQAMASVHESTERARAAFTEVNAEFERIKQRHLGEEKVRGGEVPELPQIPSIPGLR
jgi:hypothetical protein